jgi:hypothetical protein
MGHDIANHHGHNAGQTSNVSGKISSQGLLMLEIASEEDSHEGFPKNNLQVQLNLHQSIKQLDIPIPSELFYTIWLPPDLA